MRATTLLLTAALTLTSTAVFAQSSYNVVVEPVSQTVDAIINAPIEYNDQGIVKAQHFNADNLTDAQYQELLDEADRIRAYRTANGMDFENDYIETEVVQGSYTEYTPANTTSSYEYVPETASTYQIELFAPESSSTSYTGSVSSIQSHTVSKGDTLYNISKRYDTSVSAIQSENGFYGTALSIGQQIRIPGTRFDANNSVAQRTYASTPMNDSYVTRRIVEPTPQSISPRFEQATAASEAVYAVLPKDTLYSISRRTCVGVSDIVSRNSINNPNALTPGQRLTLPAGHCLTR